MIGKTGLIFESATADGKTIDEVIEGDKQYGKMSPANGEFFTYAVFNEDKEISLRAVERAFAYAQKRWSIYGDFPRYKRVTKDYNGIIDFKIEFRTVETDPDKKLSAGTVMYHYYPINDVTHPLRGLCVINSAFFFTMDGEPVTGAFMASKGIQVQFADGHYETLDIDAILGHELGHGHGLPHDPEPMNMMSYRVDLMVEYPSRRDQLRIQAKRGARKMSRWHLIRWLRYLKVASERR